MLDTAVVASLMRVMREQLQVLNDLADIGDKKTQVIVEGNLPDLDILVKGEQTLLVHLNRLEGKRYELQRTLATQNALAVEDFTFARLIASVEPAQAKELTALQQSYQDSVGRLSAQRETNTALIQQALQYVNFSLKVMTGVGAQSKSGTYTAQGQRNDAQGTRPRKMMDGRI